MNTSSFDSILANLRGKFEELQLENADLRSRLEVGRCSGPGRSVDMNADLRPPQEWSSGASRSGGQNAGKPSLLEILPEETTCGSADRADDTLLQSVASNPLDNLFFNPRRQGAAGQPMVVPGQAGPVDSTLPCLPYASEIKKRMKWVRTPNFDMGFGLLVVLDAIYMGVSLQFQFLSSESRRVWLVGDMIFSLTFCFELLVRILAFQMKFFTGSVKNWNTIDLICILSGLTGTVLQIANVKTCVWIFRVLKVMRVARLIRTFKMTRQPALQHLKRLCHTIVYSLHAFGSAMIMLIVVMYMFGLVFMQGVDEYVHSFAKTDVEGTQEVLAYFGGFPATLWTLFHSITGGDWEEPAMVLGIIGPWYSWLYCSYILFTSFLVLNIVNAVFVQVAVDAADSNKELVHDAAALETSALLADIGKWFVEADVDNSGTVSRRELEELLNDEHFTENMKMNGIDFTDAKKIFSLLDKDNTGNIDLEEFVSGLVSLRGWATAIHMATLQVMCEKMFEKMLSKIQHIESSMIPK